MPKGPYDRIEELRQKKADLQRRIAKGESGDGNKKPDLNAQLQIVKTELNTLLSANPERRLFPTSKK